MSTIRDTVAEALRSAGQGTYLSYAEGAITALNEREIEIARGIIEAAGRQGMDENTVRELLDGLGMAVPIEQFDEAPAAASNGAPVDVNAMLAEINRTLDAIKQAARDNGITIRV